MYLAALQNNICMSENLCSATVLHYKAVLSHKCCLYNLDILHLAVFKVSHFDHFRGSGVYTLCLSVTFSITPPTKGVKNINASC